MYTAVFDFIEYYFNEVQLCELNDLFGPTHPELGFIIYIWYFVRKFKGIFRR
jgi:hypothetical protein